MTKIQDIFPPEIERFYKEMIGLELELSNLLKDITLYQPLEPSKIELRIKEKTSVLRLEELRWPLKFLNPFLNKILALLKQYDIVEERELSRFEEHILNGDLSLEQLIEAVFKRKDEFFQKIEEALQIDAWLLLFVGERLARPIFSCLSLKFKDFIKEEGQDRGSCILCGNRAYISILSDGKRLLRCALCNYEWQVTRFGCPFCGNKDQEKLRFFYLEEGPFRVDVCENCKGYIKTFDKKKRVQGKEDSFELDYFRTFYLNIIAYNEGYKER
jgi:FdhE protein